jgi:glutamate---cysteine ligase / carboxylate-amine ligase
VRDSARYGAKSAGYDDLMAGVDHLQVVHPPAWPETPALATDDWRSAFAEDRRAFTVGVEEELMLIDAQTLELAPVADDVLAQIGDPRFHGELRRAQIEVVTGVHPSAASAARELEEFRRILARRLDGHPGVLAAGTHPFASDWGPISDDVRYSLLADEYTWATQRSLACGLHVHVAVPGPERALAVYNALRSYLPVIAALAANSPFYEGRDTGLCSIRPKLNEAFPRSGIPPAFASWEDVCAFVQWGRAGGLFPDPTHFWWDLRLHPDHGTLELRIADAQTHVSDSAALVAFYQGLAMWLAARHDDGDALPVHEAHRIAENSWRAMRYGVRGHLVDLDTGVPEPTREHVQRLLEAIRPFVAATGSLDELLGIRALLAGNGADRQRYVAEREGMYGLVAWLVGETEASGRAPVTAVP